MNRIERIKTCLQQHLNCSILDIIDESHQHRPRSITETHIKIIAVTEQFTNHSLIARHRLINQWLAEEFKQGLHALSLSLFTPDEWAQCQGHAPASPPCTHTTDKR